TFRCPYHGWIYATDGRLVGVPAERAVYGTALDRSGFGLPRARVATCWGLVFATWDEGAPSLEEHLGIASFYLPTMFGLTAGGLDGVPQERAEELCARLTPEQLDCLVRFPMTVGTLFPNFSFLRAPLRTILADAPAPAFTIRVWQPVAVDATEVWSWALAH